MICLFGINHTTASLEVREKFSSSDEEALGFLKKLLNLPEVEEAVFLSTCNRSELYLSVGTERIDEIRRDVLERLRVWKDAGDEEMDCFYHYRHSHAVAHVFEVAAGLDSMVLGENQVLGQLKQAYRLSATRGLTGRVLDRLFHKAFESGKRVRTETLLNKGSSSMSSVAVGLAAELLEDLRTARVLLIGKGKAGSLALQSLSDRGCSNMHVSGRNPENAAEATGRYGAEVCDFASAKERLGEYDVVIVSTAAPQPLIRSEDIARISPSGCDPLLIIDLSVPRNVELPSEHQKHVHIYNVDDLEDFAERTKARRSAEVEKAQRILEEQRADFLSWLASLELSPTIHELKRKTRSLYEKELSSLEAKVSPEEFKRLEEFVLYIEGRWLGLIVRNLRQLTEEGKNLGYIEMLHSLFELEGSDE